MSAAALALPPEPSDAERMMRLFPGNEHAHGTHGPPVPNPAKGGKLEIRAGAKTIPGGATAAMWEQHIKGERPLGIIAIRADDTCSWGAIDVDVHEGLLLLHSALVKELDRRKIQGVVDRSKSGGAHVYLFSSEPVPASTMRKALRAVADALDQPDAEIFPKQDHLDHGDKGSWLRMPYFGDSGYGIKASGLAMTAEEFLDYAEERRVSPADLEALATRPRGSEEPRAAGDGPAYAARYLERCCERLSRLRDGRNRYLNKIAYFLGATVEAGWIDGGLVAARLRQAAAAAGMDPATADDVIQRALADGAKQPPPEIEFEKQRGGSPAGASQRNIRAALRRLAVSVSHDEFEDRLIVEGLDDCGPVLDDRAMERLYLLTDEMGLRSSKDFFFTVVRDEARRAAHHPVREYLSSLAWDQQPRLDLWLTTYGGAEDSPFNRAVGTLLLVAAVSRVRRPGCKFDEMVVLESEQGTNKSSALQLLAVEEDWFSDDLPLNAEGKRVIEALSGRWIVEAAELKGMRKGEVEHLKAFLSRRRDRARMSYDRLVTEVPRQCVIVGTTNSAQYLRDGTGNRRFWPVKVAKFDLDLLARDRDQLWAEAAVREAAGGSIRLDPALWAEAAQEQKKREVVDPFIETFHAVLGEMTGKLRAADAWTILDIPDGRRTQEHNARLGEAMTQLGWTRKRLRFGAGLEYAYVRGDDQRRIRVVPAGEGYPACAQYEDDDDIPI